MSESWIGPSATASYANVIHSYTHTEMSFYEVALAGANCSGAKINFNSAVQQFYNANSYLICSPPHPLNTS
jgi:hypothetical protein